MSTVFYRYNYNLSYMDDSTKQVIKHTIIDGDEGLSFKFISVNGNEFYRFTAIEIKNSTFTVKEKINTIETTRSLSYNELLEILNKTDVLKFVLDYINKKNSNLNSKSKSSKSNKNSESIKHIETSKPKKNSTISKHSKTDEVKHSKTDKTDKVKKTKH